MKKYYFDKPTRDVSRVFIHCSASSRPEHDSIHVIKHWHMARGFNDIGYHFFITFEGNIQKGRPLEKKPAAQAGNNTGTIAICLHGLIPQDFKIAQIISLQNLVQQINAAYDGNISFHGHCEVSDKPCPVLDYKDVLSLDKFGYLDKKSLVGPKFLKIFDRGMDVISLQMALNLHYKNEGLIETVEFDNRKMCNPVRDEKIFPISVDGVFGATTQRAVMYFQKNNGLEPDGIVGPYTRLKLPSRPGI